MSFPYPENPSDWQAAYTRDQAYADSGRHSAKANIVFFVCVFIVAVFLGVLVAPLIKISSLDYRFQVAFGMAMLIVSALLFLVIYSRAFRFALDFMEKFYQPPENIDLTRLINYRMNGVSLLPFPLNLFIRFQYVMARDGDLVKSSEWPAWMARHLGGPLLLIVFDGSALYLERGNRFSRVVGPGEKPPFLEWYETIKYVVDLRPKMREGEITVWTQDGISIRLKIQIQCRIGDPKRTDQSSNLIYPYDPEAVKKAIERHSVRWIDRAKGEPEEFTWVDAAWGQATGIVPGYIGSRTLDDLFVANRNNGQILSPEAVQDIFNRLNTATQVFGVFVMDFQVLEVKLPKEVEAALKELWMAERKGMATVVDGATKAQAIRTRETAKAEAQYNIILAIANGLERNRDGHFVEPLLLSLSGVLDQSLPEPLTRAYLAKETLDTLEQLKKILDDPDNY